jgi:hypothetical protein
MEDESCDEGFTLSNSELENRFHQIIGSIEDILIGEGSFPERLAFSYPVFVFSSFLGR